MQAVDEGIAAIVNTLKANGQFDNTYIFFTSDNGYHLGNHRQVVGKIAPYEEELRVTMMVRGPGVPVDKTLEQIAGNIDLAPTWAALAGAKTPDFVDGRSLVPLLRANPPALNEWRQAFSLENGFDQIVNTKVITPNTESSLLEPQDQDEIDMSALPGPQRAKRAVPPFRGVRLQNLSYVEYVTGEKELYDLRTDPYQLQNLAAKANPHLLMLLAARVKALAICKGATCRTAEDAPFKFP